MHEALKENKQLIILECEKGPNVRMTHALCMYVQYFLKIRHNTDYASSFALNFSITQIVLQLMCEKNNNYCTYQQLFCAVFSMSVHLHEPISYFRPSAADPDSRITAQSFSEINLQHVHVYYLELCYRMMCPHLCLEICYSRCMFSALFTCLLTY